MTQHQKTTNPDQGVCEKLCNIVNPFKSSTQPISATNTNIPMGFDPHVRDLSPQKPKKTSRKKHTFERKEIVIVNGQGNYQKGVSRKDGLAHGVFEKAALPIEAKEHSLRVSVEKIDSKKNNDLMYETRDHDGDKFSDYISQVKNKILRTMTRVNAGDHGAGRVVMKRRDSFDDRVTDYIDRAKIKIRTTTNVGDEKGLSSK